MTLPAHKTKIVCTIGPASESPEVIAQMLGAGMNVARINFSHGDFPSHQKTIKNLRVVAQTVKKRLAIMADLSGPKIRIGQLVSEPIELQAGEMFTLTTQEMVGDAHQVSVTFPRLAEVVKSGDILFLNDGFIQLEAIAIEGSNLHCRVLVGGELRSRKGLNLPGIELGISAFTKYDYQCLKFALEQGVDAVSQSFVEAAADIAAVRNAAADLGYHPMIFAKIERSRALDHLDDILEAADGIMIARGDLGVEVPIEQIAVIQKHIMHKANVVGKPVITATQMLESMTTNRRPTRAEATDVANAILDGTDCVMLSEESALGKYPVDAVTMLAKIAAATEPFRSQHSAEETLKGINARNAIGFTDLIALSVEAALKRISPGAVFVCTRSGSTARGIARLRLLVWIVAVSSHAEACQQLQFSYGVYPVYERDYPENWNAYIKGWLHDHEVAGNLAVLTAGPSSKHPEANTRMEIIDLS
jgi:pyruvate kinase